MLIIKYLVNTSKCGVSLGKTASIDDILVLATIARSKIERRVPLCRVSVEPGIASLGCFSLAEESLKKLQRGSRRVTSDKASE